MNSVIFFLHCNSKNKLFSYLSYSANIFFMHIAKAAFFNKLEPALRFAIKHARIEGENVFEVLVDKNSLTDEQLEQINEKGLIIIQPTKDGVITGQTHVQNLENIATLDFVRLIMLKN